MDNQNLLDGEEEAKTPECVDDPDQLALFEMEPDWKKEWQDMPEFVQEDLTSIKTVYIHFKSLQDMRDFSKLIGQPITDKTRNIWYPVAEIGHYIDKEYVDE